MTNDYIVTKTAVIITMRKPVYGSLFYIRDKYIKIARDKKIPLVIKSPEGTSTWDVKDWMRGAKKMKKVFQFPDNPMILYGNFVQQAIEKRTERKKLEKKIEVTTNVLTTAYARLAKRDPEALLLVKQKLGLA